MGEQVRACVGNQAGCRALSQHRGRGEEQDQTCQGSLLGISKHISHRRSQLHELVPIEQRLYRPCSCILPDAGAMWGSWGAEHELPSRAGALRGEVQVMEIEMQILLLSREKAPINQE